MGGGGVSFASQSDRINSVTEAEIRAAVEAAENWGTYVTVTLICRVRSDKRSLRASSASSTAT